MKCNLSPHESVSNDSLTAQQQATWSVMEVTVRIRIDNSNASLTDINGIKVISKYLPTVESSQT